MNDPWKTIGLPWWLSPTGANVGSPAAPARPLDELCRESWPTTIAQTSLAPPTAISPTPPLGGLFSSLNAGPSGGILGQLAPPVEHVDSANYWGAAPAPSGTSAGPMPGSDYYLSPVPRASDWDAIPTRLSTGAAQPFPGSPSRSSSALAGNPDAGQWTSGGGEAAGVPEILSDITPDNYWIPGADYAAEHHEFPQANYKKMPLATRKVFDRATIGELFLSLDGRRHEFDVFHRQYNAATADLLDRFMQEHNIIEPEQMTPDHARAVVKAIAESNDPRIQYYREFIRRLRMFYRLRIGRGTE
jgi:hypothetical protein